MPLRVAALAFVALAMTTGRARAWTHGMAPGSLVMSNVSYPVGTLTAASRGGVALYDPVANLGLVTAGIPTSFTVSQPSGPYNCWKVQTGASTYTTLASSGTSVALTVGGYANTPVPTGSCSASTMNQAFTFSVIGSDGVSTPTATITTSPVTAAANMGSDGNSGYSGSGLQTAGGKALLLSVGFDMGGSSVRTFLNNAYLGNYGLGWQDDGLCDGVSCTGGAACAQSGATAPCYDGTAGTVAYIASGYGGTGAGFAAGQYVASGYFLAGSVGAGGDTGSPFKNTEAPSGDAIASVGTFTTGSGTGTLNMTMSAAVAPSTLFSGVAVQDADPTRPSVVNAYQIQTAAYTILNSLPVGGGSRAVTFQTQPFYFVTGSSWIALNKPYANYSLATQGSAPGVQCGTSNNLVVNAGQFLNLSSGYSDLGCSYVDIGNTVINGYSNNAYFWSDDDHTYVHDIAVLTPVAACVGCHVDMWQQSFGTNGQNVVLRRAVLFDADATAYSQTVWFGAITWNVGMFVDDGSGAGTPSGIAGNVLTVTATNGYLGTHSIANTAYLLQAPGLSGSPYITAQTVLQSGTGSGTSGTNTITLGAPNYGAWAVGLYPVGTGIATNAKITAWSPSGGGAGTATLSANNTGTVSGAVTVANAAGQYTISGSAQLVSPTVGGTYNAKNHWIDGLVYAGCATYGPEDGSANGLEYRHFVYIHADTGGQGTGACTPAYPNFSFGNASLTTGTNPPWVSGTIELGFFHGAVPSSGVTPSVLTVASTAIFTSPAGSIPTNAFAVANPETTLEAISPSTWASMTPSQIAQTLSADLAAYPSGALFDGTNYDAPFLPNGRWNDGSNLLPY